MNTLSVVKYMNVLEVICAHQNEELWINKIVKLVETTTGSKDSPKIKEIIKILKSCKFLKTTESDDHKQKEIIVLTDLGKEIINLMDILHKCENSYSHLIKMIMNYNIKISESQDIDKEQKIITNKLLSRGWKISEADFYQGIMISAFKFENMYRKNIFNTLLERVLSITTTYKIHQNIVRTILLEIMKWILDLIYKNSEEIQKYIQEIDNDDNKTSFSSFDYKTFNEIPFAENTPLIFQDIEEFYSDHSTNLLKEDIARPIEDLTINLMNLIKPADDLISFDVDKLGNEDLENLVEEEKKLLERIRIGHNAGIYNKVSKDISRLTKVRYNKILSRHTRAMQV